MVASNFMFPQDFIGLSKATPSLDKLRLVSNCSMMLEGFAAFGCSNFMQSVLSPELPSWEDNWDDSQLPEEKKKFSN